MKEKKGGGSKPGKCLDEVTLLRGELNNAMTEIAALEAFTGKVFCAVRGDKTTMKEQEVIEAITSLRTRAVRAERKLFLIKVAAEI